MRKNRNRPESDEPLSEGRVEYLEAARQRVRKQLLYLWGHIGYPYN